MNYKENNIIENEKHLTQRYAHLRDETLKNAANLAGNIIEEAGKKKTE